MAGAADASGSSPSKTAADITAGSKRKVGTSLTERTKKKNGWGWKAGGLPAGITYSGTSKFAADIFVRGKERNIGYFEKLEEAVAAYQFVEKGLEDSGLPPSDDGRISVFKEAKERVRNASTAIKASTA